MASTVKHLGFHRKNGPDFSVAHFTKCVMSTLCSWQSKSILAMHFPVLCGLVFGRGWQVLRCPVGLIQAGFFWVTTKWGANPKEKFKPYQPRFFCFTLPERGLTKMHEWNDHAHFVTYLAKCFLWRHGGKHRALKGAKGKEQKKNVELNACMPFTWGNEVQLWFLCRMTVWNIMYLIHCSFTSQPSCFEWTRAYGHALQDRFASSSPPYITYEDP